MNGACWGGASVHTWPASYELCAFRDSIEPPDGASTVKFS
jgi:hypothetical protein